MVPISPQDNPHALRIDSRRNRNRGLSIGSGYPHHDQFLIGIVMKAPDQLCERLPGIGQRITGISVLETGS